VSAAASPSRLPDATHIGRVYLQVGNLDRSLAYYAGLLGFHVLHRAPGRAELGADRPLIELRELPGAAAVPHRGRLGLFHFAILLPGRAQLGRILGRLGETGVHVGMADHAVSEALYLTDPDGLGIEIYADRPRSTWQRRGDELYMVTEALDTSSLLRAAAGAPWAGMPDGTVIGHMHLHVRDLAEARAFYSVALGLDVTASWYPGALFMSAGGYHHHLGTNIWAGAGARAPEADEARLLHWELVVPDRESAAAAAKRLEGAGHEVSSPAGSDGAWHAADPSGTDFRIVPAN
jgi:catechol 2,3-dioxygenase